jgi:hypothetical protein
VSSCDDSIKMDHKEIECEIVDRIHVLLDCYEHVNETLISV